MAKHEKLSDREIISWVGGKLSKCLNEDGGDVSASRQEAFDRYMGEPYGDERKGYSRVVTRECFEAVEWALPSILRPFTAGDQVVAFDPVGPEDEEQASQETDVVNHYLMKEGDAFTLFYEWFKDALMYPNGYVKVWVEEQEKVEHEQYQGLTAVGLATLLADENVEPLEQEAALDPALGEVYSVKIARTITRPRLIAEAVPPEQVAVDADCTSLDLDEADFVCHRVKRNHTYLREMGVPESFLENVGCGDDQLDGEAINRHFFVDEQEEDDDDLPGLREYWVSEAYCRIDVDGDGIAERRRIVLIGDKIWENEEYSYQPFVAASAMLMPHKHVGLSLLESMKDIQRLSTALWRQLLDNVYAVNNRRKFVGEGALVDGGATIEALTNPLADLIPVRDVSQVIPEAVQPVVSEILPVMDLLSTTKKIRTGVSPELSLDPNVLKDSTLGAFTNALESANQKVELITRTFAETAVRRLMLKVHRLLRENMDVQKVIKIRGKWIEVNPSHWREREDLTVNVGLGFNSKEKMVGIIMQLLQVQREALMAGIATPKNIYNALVKLVEASGLKDPNLYFTDPDTVPPQPPKPDPAVQIAQMQFQIDQSRLQLEAQKVQLQAQEQQSKDRERYAQMENDMREMARKLTELELKYSQPRGDVDVPGSLV